VTEQPEPAVVEPPPRLALVIALVVVVGSVLDLFCLLLLPLRLGGHLVPVGPVLVLGLNAVLASLGNRLASDRLPAQVLMGVALVLSGGASVRGPGGDLFITRDLQGMWLLFVVTALLGAGVPLLRRTHPD
jgi:hypothetical protein